MTIFVKINIRTSSIDVHVEYLHTCVYREATEAVSATSYSDMAKKAPWASYNYLFAGWPHTRLKIALADFVKCDKGVMLDAYWISVKREKDNIGHRLRYYLEFDAFNAV